MPEVACADCGRRIGADLYTHGITDDSYDLVNLCSDCALTRLQLARRGAGWAAAGLTPALPPETAQHPDRAPRAELR